MALGDRFMKKVTSKISSSQRAQETMTAASAPLPVPDPVHTVRTHNSNHSLLSASSADSDSRRMAHPPQPPAPSARPPSTKALAAAPPFGPPSAASVSDSSTASVSGAHSTDSVTPDIIQKGYLLVKKGLLKGYEKRFYFLTAQAPDLYCCRDEFQFADWLASGLPARRLPGMPKSKEALLPVHVCSVLRADRAGEAGAFDRAIAVIASDDPKCTAVKYLAPSADACEDWVRGFHHVQVAQRTRTASRADDGHSRTVRMGHESSTTPSSSYSGGRTPSDAHRPPSNSNRSATMAAPAARGTPHSGSAHSSHVSDTSDSPSHHSSVNGVSHIPHVSSTSSVKSGHASAAPASATAGNVLLFVPAAGSAISISDSKLLEAKKEMDALVAGGAKRPLRGGLDNTKETSWRYGPPEYVLSDLEYIKGKLRDHDATPLESYVESCCQTLLMEATHKARYAEWTSVRHEYFFIQVNDGDKIPGQRIQENDLFGLLYLNDYEVDMDLRDGEEKKDPRAILSEAFTQGFPMEVLDVYTQPPQCHFSWRHWGRFTGRYRGVRGNGELIELRGFGQMHIDGGRVMNLRLFFKQRDLFEQLNKAAAASTPSVPRATRQTSASSRADASTASSSVPARPASTSQSRQAPAPPQQQRQMPSQSQQAPPAQPRQMPSQSQQAPPAQPRQMPSQSLQAPPAQPRQMPAQSLQAPPSQQRQMRSDKVSAGTDRVDDSGDFNVVAPLPRRTQSGSTHAPPQNGATTHSTPQVAKRKQLYQQFMPQAQGA